MSWILLAISGTCLFLAAQRVSARLLRQALERAIAIPVLVFGCIVAIGELASLFGMLNRPSFWLAGSAVAVVLSRLLTPQAAVGSIGLPKWRWTGRSVALAYAIILALAVALPPNTWDSMSYHLSRIGYYLQQGHLGHFVTNNTRQTEFPVNAELAMLWTIVFLRSDRLAVLVQFTAAIGAALSVAGICLRLRLPRLMAGLAALICLSLPQIALQASSTQNDLTAAWLLCAGVYFLLAVAHTGLWSYALLAGAAIGLAVGTKPTVCLFAPGLLLWWLLELRRSTVCWHRVLPVATGAVVLGCILFAAPQYLRNCAATGHVLPRQEIVAVSHPTLRTFVANGARTSLDLMDLNGLPYPANRAICVLKRYAFAKLGVDVEWLNPADATYPSTKFGFAANILCEDVAWYGALGMLVVAGAAVHCLRSLRRGRWAHAAQVAGPFGFALLVCLLLRWQPWIARFYVAALLLLVPAAMWGLRDMFGRMSRRWRRAGWSMVCGLTATAALVAAVQNEIKPLMRIGSQPSVFAFSPEQQRCRHRPYHADLLRFVSTLPPARIGYCGDLDQWDYLAFGPDFRHSVVRYDETVDWSKAFVTDRCDLIFVQRNLFASPPNGCCLKELNSYWWIATSPSAIGRGECQKPMAE
ncbi:MAG TPA: glycosyltransferase family 39 protein [Planctomycetota bacterium]